MKKSSLKVWHVGCLSRGLGVARSVVKTVFEFEVPVQRKRPKTCKNRSFNGLALICVVFGPYLLAGIVNSKTVFTTVLATLRPLDRHPTCHTFGKLFFVLYSGSKKFSSQKGGVQLGSDSILVFCK